MSRLTGYLASEIPTVEDCRAPDIDIVFKEAVPRLNQGERAAKRRRIEEHARRYLEDDEPIHIQCAALRGPFSRWNNPWKSRGTIVDEKERPLRRRPVARIRSESLADQPVQAAGARRKQPAGKGKIVARPKRTEDLQFKNISKPRTRRLGSEQPISNAQATESVNLLRRSKAPRAIPNKISPSGNWLKRIDEDLVQQHQGLSQDPIDNPDIQQTPSRTERPSRKSKASRARLPSNALPELELVPRSITPAPSPSRIATTIHSMEDASPTRISESIQDDTPVESAPLPSASPQYADVPLAASVDEQDRIDCQDATNLPSAAPDKPTQQEGIPTYAGRLRSDLKRKARFMTFGSPTPIKKLKPRTTSKASMTAESQILVEASFVGPVQGAQQHDTADERIHETPITVQTAPAKPRAVDTTQMDEGHQDYSEPIQEDSNKQSSREDASLQDTEARKHLDAIHDGSAASADHPHEPTPSAVECTGAPQVGQARHVLPASNKEEEFATAPQQPVLTSGNEKGSSICMPPLSEEESTSVPSNQSIVNPQNLSRSNTDERPQAVPSFPERQDSKAYSPLTLDMNTQAALAKAQAEFAAEFVSPDKYFRPRSPEKARRRYSNIASTQDLMSAAQGLILGTSKKAKPRKRASFVDWPISKPMSVSDENKDPSAEDEGESSQMARPSKPPLAPVSSTQNSRIISASQPQPILKKRPSLRQLDSLAQSNSQPSPSASTAFPAVSFLPPATYASAPESLMIQAPLSYEEGQRMFPSNEDADDDFNVNAVLDDMTNFLAVDYSFS